MILDPSEIRTQKNDLRRKKEEFYLKTQIGYWFKSLMDGTETVKKFRGSVGITTGLTNLIIAFFLVNIILVPLSFFYGMGMIPTIGIEWFLLFILGFIVITDILGIVSWLVSSFLTHLFAGILGGNGEYQEYAALVTFPQAGLILLNMTLGLIPLIGMFVNLAGAGLAIISQVSIIKEEYGLGTIRAVIALILPGILMIISLVILGLSLLFLVL